MSEIINLVFVDCETTGLDPERDHIVEVAAVRVDNTYAPLQTFHAYILPKIPVPEHVAKINGYSKEVWEERGAISIGSLFHSGFFEVIRGGTYAGQNPGFDRSFLERSYALWRENAVSKSEICPAYPEMDYHLIDVASLAYPLQAAGLIPGVGLRHTRKLFDLKGEQHRALSDVLDTIEVFKKLMAIYTDGGIKRRWQR